MKQALPNCTPWIHHNVLWENFDTDLVEPTDPHGIVTAGNVLGVIENNLIGRTDGNGSLTSVNGAADDPAEHLLPERQRRPVAAAGTRHLLAQLAAAFDLSQSVLAERDRGGPVAGRRR